MIKTTKKKGSIVASVDGVGITFTVPWEMLNNPWQRRDNDDRLHSYAAFMLALRLSLIPDTACTMECKRVNGTTRIHTPVPIPV